MSQPAWTPAVLVRVMVLASVMVLACVMMLTRVMLLALNPCYGVTCCHIFSPLIKVSNRTYYIVGEHLWCWQTRPDQTRPRDPSEFCTVYYVLYIYCLLCRLNTFTSPCSPESNSYCQMKTPQFPFLGKIILIFGEKEEGGKCPLTFYFHLVSMEFGIVVNPLKSQIKPPLDTPFPIFCE